MLASWLRERDQEREEKAKERGRQKARRQETGRGALGTNITRLPSEKSESSTRHPLRNPAPVDGHRQL